MKYGLSLFVMLVATTAWADFISSPSLDKVVKASVEDCSSSTQLNVPVITWGADIATIHANGDAKETQKGSAFDQKGLKVTLTREDVFSKQLENYMTCKSPFLRGTVGMINMAAPVTEKSAKTKMRVIYQLSWSAGGDALVVSSKIKKPKDLKGKSIAVQAYGPHVDYLAKVLTDAGLTVKDVNIKWVKDLTGTKQTPGAALQSGQVDAALVITPDALALTSNGTVGTGSEDSVKGATVLLSTKTANKVIADVYVVREDFYQANKEVVFKFVDALYKAEESTRDLMSKKGSAETTKLLKASAKLLLDSEQAVADTQGLYGDAQLVAFSGNKKFFEDKNYPRSLENLNKEVQASFSQLGLISGKSTIAKADWKLEDFKKGLLTADKAEAPSFDTNKVANLVSKKQKQGNLDNGALFGFEVYFKPNQNDFPMDLYKEAFDKVIALASTYGGALITIEGHSDPLGYLKKKKENESSLVLNQIRQSAKNLSLTRSNAVKDSLIKYAKSKGVTLDASQLAIVGHGIDSPKNGNCGGEPCAPKSEKEWLDNMRVEFRIIQVEAEQSVFEAL